MLKSNSALSPWVALASSSCPNPHSLPFNITLKERPAPPSRLHHPLRSRTASLYYALFSLNCSGAIEERNVTSDVQSMSIESLHVASTCIFNQDPHQGPILEVDPKECDEHFPVGQQTLPSGSTSSRESFFCSICVETDSDVLDRALIPSCGHSFCVDCLLSWATIRVACPNCKSPFDTLSVHRADNGEPMQGPWTRDLRPPQRVVKLPDLRNLTWVVLREIHSARHDIETSFSFPPIPRDANEFQPPPLASSSTQHYFHEEAEDELEERFWEEEEKQYHQLMRRGRVISNRRFGAKGYIAAGHMRAKPKAVQPSRKQNRASEAGSSRAHAGIDAAPESSDAKSGGSSVGGRKKKVKKKSRAGIAAARAAAAAAQNEHDLNSTSE